MKRLIINLLSIVFFLGAFFLAPNGASAGEEKKAFVGLLLGPQSVTPSFQPFSYGIASGIRGGILGVQAFYLYGTKTYKVLNIPIEARCSQFGVQGDLYPFSSNFFYFGPRVSVTTLSFGFASVSGTLFGGGGGFNIPLGASLSIGADGSYMQGKISGVSQEISTYMGSIKYWF